MLTILFFLIWFLQLLTKNKQINKSGTGWSRKIIIETIAREGGGGTRFERCWVCAYRTYGTRSLERLANPYFATLRETLHRITNCTIS